MTKCSLYLPSLTKGGFVFLFIKNKWLFIASEGFSTLEKKHPDMLPEAMLPIQSV
jgi:hypothetical protein